MGDCRLFCGLLVGSVLVAIAPPAAAQEIEITACVGDASRCFDAFTVDLGIASSGGLVIGPGAPAGAPTFDPVAVTKAPDDFTPDLARFAVQGTLLPEASIELTDPDAAPGNVLLTVALENVLVTRVAIAVGQDGRPVESVEFEYQQITLTAGAATFCWDRVLHRRCSWAARRVGAGRATLVVPCGPMPMFAPRPLVRLMPGSGRADPGRARRAAERVLE